MLPISLSESTLMEVHVHFKIANNSVYLGIAVTGEICCLYRENFHKLKSKIQPELIKWSPLYLSLVGREYAVKMSVMPRFLYLFRCVLVCITNAKKTKLVFQKNICREENEMVGYLFQIFVSIIGLLISVACLLGHTTQHG